MWMKRNSHFSGEFVISFRSISDLKYNNNNHPNFWHCTNIEKIQFIRIFGQFLWHWSVSFSYDVEAYSENRCAIKWSKNVDFTDELWRWLISAFKVIHKTYEPHAAWSVALRHPHLRSQAHFLVSICCLIRNFKNNEVVLCDRCGKLFSDPIVHAVASCDYLEKIRDTFWCDVININPITFSVYLAKFVWQRTLLLLVVLRLWWFSSW